MYFGLVTSICFNETFLFFFFDLKLMVATLPGDLMGSVQNHVEAEIKLEAEIAPVHHQHMAERTAVSWDQVRLPENATLGNAQVRCSVKDTKNAKP